MIVLFIQRKRKVKFKGKVTKENDFIFTMHYTSYKC